MAHDVLILLLRLGLVAILYFFLLQLLVVLWRDLRPRTAASAAQQAAAGPHLDILDAAGSGRVAGESLPLLTITSLGRSQSNTIALNDPGVSGEHALVSFRLGQWWVEDVGSTNGTFLNDARVEQPTVIHTGDGIRLGMVRLRVNI